MNIKEKEPFKSAIKILKVMGIWMGSSPTKTDFFYGISMHLIFVDLCLILQIGYLFTFNTIGDLLNLMTVLPTYCGIFLKTLNIMTNYQRIEKIFQMTEQLLDKCSDCTRVANRLKFVETIFKFVLFIATASCLVGVVATIFELPYKMWFPFDTDESRIGYWVAAAYQSVDTTSLAAATMCIDFIPVFFLSYAIGFLEILCDRLSSFEPQKISQKGKTDRKQKNVENDEMEEKQINNYEELLKCVQFQLDIYEYFEQINKVFSTLFFIQGLISTLILCTSSVTLTLVSK